MHLDGSPELGLSSSAARVPVSVSGMLAQFGQNMSLGFAIGGAVNRSNEIGRANRRAK
jgi:uncharacterized membrane protein (Fun14 family)